MDAQRRALLELAVLAVLPGCAGMSPPTPSTPLASGAPYFRTLPRFQTADPRYAFLNRLIAVGTGEIRSDGPVHEIEELL